VFIQRIRADSFHNFKSISAFNLPQSENISATNGRVVMPFGMSAEQKDQEQRDQ
jgi:hypothetical protein